MSQEAINSIKIKNKTYLFAYYKFISSLYPLLEKSNKYPDSNPIPHIGESHCLSFAHQTLNISPQINRIQPVLISGGKAWHFANNKNNQWKNSLTEQMKNHNYSDKVFISFGEIDCRKEEGILNYSYKKNKDISKVCEATINGYLNYMEKVLSPNYSERYYFGVPAPTIEEKLLDDFDKKRIKLVELYNLILKKEVLSKGSYFVDVYKLTTNKDGLNNNIYMCDNIHLSPKCLSILFENYYTKVKLYQIKFLINNFSRIKINIKNGKVLRESFSLFESIIAFQKIKLFDCKKIFYDFFVKSMTKHKATGN